MKTKIELFEFRENSRPKDEKKPIHKWDISNYDLLRSISNELNHITWPLEKFDHTRPETREITISWANLSSITSYFENPNNEIHLEGKRIYRRNFHFCKEELDISIFRVKRVYIILIK